MDHDYARPVPELASVGAALIQRARDKPAKPSVWSGKRTRVNVGVEYPRWRMLRSRLGIKKDQDLATVLIDSFFKKNCPDDACSRKHTLFLQKSRDECKDTWETASEDSSSDEDCVASICLRLGSDSVNTYREEDVRTVEVRTEEIKTEETRTLEEDGDLVDYFQVQHDG